MKILQIVDQLKVGGAERVIVDMTNLLSSKKHDVSILCLLDNEVLNDEINNDIPQFFLKRKGRLNIKSMYECYQILKNYDILHIHMRHNLRYIYLVLLLFFLRKKVVYQDHTGKTNISNFTKKCLESVDCYVGVSKQICDWAKKIPLSNIVLLPNIIRKKEVKQQVVMPKSIVMVGNIRQEKNYEFALELINILPTYTLTIYGNIGDNTYYQKILKQIKENDLSQRVHIVQGVNDIQSQLPQYQLAIHTSPLETGPLVLMEYMAQNIPFISYETGQVVEQIKNELPLFVMNEFIIEKWKERILALCEQQELSIIIDKIEKTYQHNFSSENYYHQCLQIYQNLN